VGKLPWELAHTILTDRTQLSPQDIQRIEAIVGPVAIAANFKYHATREQGLVKGLQAFINHYTKRSWW
jgi:hypothetical protein